MFLLVLHIAMESGLAWKLKKIPTISDHLMIYNDIFLTEVQKRRSVNKNVRVEDPTWSGKYASYNSTKTYQETPEWSVTTFNSYHYGWHVVFKEDSLKNKALTIVTKLAPLWQYK